MTNDSRRYYDISHTLIPDYEQQTGAWAPALRPLLISHVERLILEIYPDGLSELNENWLTTFPTLNDVVRAVINLDVDDPEAKSILVESVKAIKSSAESANA